MKITIIHLRIGILTHKTIWADVKDPDVEEERIYAQGTLKNPLLAIECIIKCDEKIEPGCIYMDDHAQSWRAFTDSLDGDQLSYIDNDANQFWAPDSITQIQSVTPEGKSTT